MAIPWKVHPDDVKAMLALIGIDTEADRVRYVSISPSSMTVNYDIGPDEKTTKLVIITPEAEKRS